MGPVERMDRGIGGLGARKWNQGRFYTSAPAFWAPEVESGPLFHFRTAFLGPEVELRPKFHIVSLYVGGRSAWRVGRADFGPIHGTPDSQARRRTVHRNWRDCRLYLPD